MMARLLAVLALVAQAATPPLTAETINATVRSASQVIAAEYFNTSVTPRIASALADAAAAGQFASAKTADDLATRINDLLYSLTRDKHLRIHTVAPPSVASPRGGAPTPRDRPTTAGFKRTEILPGNIGLLELTSFMRPSEHRDAMAAAMKQLAPADALIIDLRANGGGSPATVALLISYLLDEPDAPLFDIIPRDGAADTYRTEPASVALPRNGRRPIFVLTSSRSFSGGEGLAYLLQERRRATIVGEQTAGAANPGRDYPVNNLFEITIPNGHISSAIKHGNWEGDGVTPDLSVPADQALDVAIERARAILEK